MVISLVTGICCSGPASLSVWLDSTSAAWFADYDADPTFGSLLLEEEQIPPFLRV